MSDRKVSQKRLGPLLGIKLFGKFEISPDTEKLSHGIPSQLVGLLAMLAETPGRPRSRVEIIDELWPGVNDESTRNRFRVLLSGLRKILEPEDVTPGTLLVRDRTMVAIAGDRFTVDTTEFQKHLDAAKNAFSIEARALHYRSADALYGGEFLSGRSGDWITERRGHYARLQSLSQYKYAAILEEAGDSVGAMQQIARSIEADPLRESPRRRLFRLLAESGDVGSALEQYEIYRTLLKKSVNLVPSKELQEWIKGLRIWRPFPQGASDLVEIEPIDRKAAFARVTLPTLVSTFVGRSSEIAELSDLLPLYRWITLTGPGGIGKTRLAVEVARANLEFYGGGIVFVEIGDLTRSPNILDLIVRQLRLAPSSDPLRQLRDYFSQPITSGRNAYLLVLDGIDRFTSETSHIAIRLLREIPNATVLATTRMKPGLPGFYEYPVNPLPVPERETKSDRHMANPSVQLFHSRAKSASERYTVTPTSAFSVTEICRRLEGIPLAIELAAAQAINSSVDEILKSLDGKSSPKGTDSRREPRHHSLYTSLSFSFDSLPNESQLLFCKLCIFRGTFGADAANIVASASPDAMELIARTSLISRSGDRFAMLNLIREFGWLRLSPELQAKVRGRHAGYYLRLVIDAEALHVNSGIEPPFYRTEIDNLFFAAEWFMEANDVESATQMALGLVPACIASGFQREGRSFIHSVKDKLHPNRLQSALLDLSEGTLACFEDDPTSAREPLMRAAEHFEKAGMHERLGMAHWNLAFGSYLAGNFQECLNIPSVKGPYFARAEAYRMHLIGLANLELGNLSVAWGLLDESLKMFWDLGNFILADYSRLSMARVIWKEGRLNESALEYRTMIGKFFEWKETRGIAYSVEGLARVTIDQGSFELGAKLLGMAQRLREAAGLRRDFADAIAFDSARGTCREKLGHRFEHDWDFGHGIAPSDVTKWIVAEGSNRQLETSSS